MPAPGSDDAEAVAAVDLGSNSFHMVIARFVEHDLHILDRLREPVRLADGLDARNRLDPTAWERALPCLERFGQRIRGFPRSRVRAVGTNTLRRARNSREFREAAARALGHPIEVLSGSEEARLIYEGVAHSHPWDERRRLVVDIGGGSTEIIVGEGFEVVRSHSLFMGCVTFSRDHFPNGETRRELFGAAEIAAGLELRAIEDRIRKLGWTAAIGASGTVDAVAGILRANGWGGPEITIAGMKKLRQALVAAGHAEAARLDGLRPDRAPVLPGGLAILIAIFRRLDIASMMPSSGALREGVLYDLVGRILHRDVRDRTIRRLSDQYHVDLAQADRVRETAIELLSQVVEPWGLDAPTAKQLLSWAADLHEIGLAVSHTGYHKHGAYLVTFSDMPGFSADEQKVLAALIRGHRRKLPPALFSELEPASSASVALRLCVIFRLAVLLNRSRAREATPKIVLGDRGKDGIRLEFPPGWLEDRPLTRTDLEEEATRLEPAGVRLSVTLPAS